MHCDHIHPNVVGDVSSALGSAEAAEDLNVSARARCRLYPATVEVGHLLVAPEEGAETAPLPNHSVVAEEGVPQHLTLPCLGQILHRARTSNRLRKRRVESFLEVQIACLDDALALVALVAVG